MIEFYSLNKSDKNIKKKILKSISKVIDQNNFIMGSDVKVFENKFKYFCRSKFAISCANGTDALTMSLISLNLKPGSEVILPAMTYISTFYSVINANLKPVLVDINENDPLININEIKKKINKYTKVIIPVHLYGSVVEINKIKKITKGKNIFIVDDCAQAHGAEYSNGDRVGGSNLANISTFSLYPGKNLGAYGDAGIITTNNKNIAKKIAKIRNQGFIKKFNHETIGFNSRLDTIQASILNHKINNLKKLNKLRKKIASIYKKNIKNKNIKLIEYSDGSVFHQFVIRVKNRKLFLKYLIKRNIQYGLHYPHTINQTKFYKRKFSKIFFKNAENFAKQCVSLPIDPMLTIKEINYIVNTINKY